MGHSHYNAGMERRILWSDLGKPEPGQPAASNGNVNLDHLYLNSAVLEKLIEKRPQDAWLIFRTVHIFTSAISYLVLIDFEVL